MTVSNWFLNKYISMRIYILYYDEGKMGWEKSKNRNKIRIKKGLNKYRTEIEEKFYKKILNIYCK